MTFPVPGSNWSYTRSYYVYKPSDDDSGETDANAVNGLLAQGKAVLLQPGEVYFFNQPFDEFTNGSFINGQQWWSASAFDSYGAGTGAPGGAVLRATADFSGDYAMSMFNASGSNQFYGVDIGGITLDMSQATQGGGGILADGAWGACFLRGVAILQPQGDCLHFAADDTSGKVPDDWQVTGCKFSASQGGAGVYADDIPDSWFTDCESSQNAAHNWDINYSINTRITVCKGEGSVNGAGFHFGGNGTGDVVTLTGCTTQYNLQDGFLFDNSAGGSSESVYQLANCVSTHDNQAAGTYAGYRSDGSLARVMGSGCVAIGAAYGAYEGSTSYFMCFTGSYLSGTTAATHDDGTNTHALVNQSPVAF